MYGFRIAYGSSTDWHLEAAHDELLRSVDMGNLHITQLTKRKFLNDKLWLDTDASFLASEGVLFNRQEILRQPFGASPADWRGSFVCVCVNKDRQTLRVFNDQVGSKMIFWTQCERGIFVSQDIFELTRVSGKTELDSDFMFNLLAKGYDNTGRTIVKGIRRLGPGRVLEINENVVVESEYYKLSNEPLYDDSNASVDELNFRFRKAVKRILDKNAEYGLRNLFPLSGGLDSRMVVWVANQLTDVPIENFTYSQTGHYDHLIPSEIASYLHNKWDFWALDGGDYLPDIDPVVRLTQMYINYNGPLEMYEYMKRCDWTNVGVVANGVNGETVFSEKTDADKEIRWIYGASLFYNNLCSPLMLQTETESCSPFLDIDVLEYVLHVPAKMRWNYHFYDRWVLRCYPEAARWHHEFETIGDRPVLLNVFGRKIPLRDLLKRICMSALNRLHIYNGYRDDEGESMNPYDSWIRTNPAMKEALDTYFEANIHLLDAYPDVQLEARRIYEYSVVDEKCRALTILSALKMLS